MGEYLLTLVRPTGLDILGIGQGIEQAQSDTHARYGLAKGFQAPLGFGD
jgi:hypothetical protein